MKPTNPTGCRPVKQPLPFRRRLRQTVLFALLIPSISGTWAHIPAQTFPPAPVQVETAAPGVLKITVGKPDTYTPYVFCPEQPRAEALAGLPEGALPFPLEEITAAVTARGCEVSVPLASGEQLYGFGLQTGSFGQRGLKKKPIVNDHPLNTLGYSHAPQPFYVSTSGYGILINTFRYTAFYCGTHTKKEAKEATSPAADGTVASSTEELYRNKRAGSRVYIDIPQAKGIEIYVFKGTRLTEAVQRYNLFSGGGCLPPLWGLGLKYRTKTDFTQQQVAQTAAYLREKQIPCDVIGLEPGWHTAAYSCSYVWNKERFPSHQALLDTLKQQNFRVNLWEHAYVHPSSPLWDSLYAYSGDFLVWQGLVPDFTLKEARVPFANYHRRLMEEGISGFKLDECDNSNIASGNATWGFPEMSRFPSGMDGEQMHQAFGLLYLNTLNEIYKGAGVRTYQDYRSSGLFASSLPATLYSDIYGHKDYVQMVCNSAFGGLLWSPEVRKSASRKEFFHRLQTVLLSAQAVVNSWYLQHPPWMQYDTEKNNRNEFLPDVAEMEENVRLLVNLRMQLIPYLYNAFAMYYLHGMPPFRPLVMDYPADKKAASVDDQFMAGPSLLATPLVDEGDSRTVYLPAGNWYNFNTGEKYAGGCEYTVTFRTNELPVFVKEGAILPLARPVQYVTAHTVFHLSCRVYGTATEPVQLFEDDGVSYRYREGEYNLLTLTPPAGKQKKGKLTRKGNYPHTRYKITGWEYVE